jgi:L-threonylcarbamoyladenylate synthase
VVGGVYRNCACPAYAGGGAGGGFLAGPLTLVLPKRACVPDLVSSGLSTVAVRWSAHALLQAVLDQFGRPLAAPSANRFGRISPTTAEHVYTELNQRISLVLDGGAAAHGVESTIVAPFEGGVRILRSGPVTREQLEAFGRVEDAVGGDGLPEAPGQLKSHYAPQTPLELLEDVTTEGLSALAGPSTGIARVAGGRTGVWRGRDFEPARGPS